MTEKLYAFGDSWTCPNRENELFPKWPEIVATLQGYEFKNFGYSGFSNTAIFNRFLQRFYLHDDIGIVMILWSAPTRVKFGSVSLKPRWTDHNKVDRKKYFLLNQMLRCYGNLIEEPDDDTIFQCMIDYLIQLKTVQELCKSRNIKLVMAQAFDFSKDFEDNEHRFASEINQEWKNSLKKSDIVQPLDQNSLFGWPFNKKFGGFTMADLMDKTGIHLRDSSYHPTAEGHEFIADTFCSFMDY